MEPIAARDAPSREPLAVKPSVLERFGLTPVINANGAASRLGGNLLSEAALEAMTEAARRFVPLHELQACASETIPVRPGRTRDVSLRGGSVSVFRRGGLYGGRRHRCDGPPADTDGLRNEIVMHRAHRNPYDHALRATGARLVEVGYLGGPSSPGTRGWEIESAITDRTCACLYLASGPADPEVLPLRQLPNRPSERLPLIVDAAGAMPPAGNLTRFIRDGADLVAFSGGKGIGAPAGSGFLAGRRDLVLRRRCSSRTCTYIQRSGRPTRSAEAPFSSDPPRQGIGRMLKVGREEIAGLMAALAEYVERDHAADDARDLAVATEIAEAAARGEWSNGLACRSSPEAIRCSRLRKPRRRLPRRGGRGEPPPGLASASSAWTPDPPRHHQLQPTTLLDEEVEALCERVAAECEAPSKRDEMHDRRLY